MQHAREDEKHGKMRKHVFAHGGANAYGEMEMENGGKKMNFTVIFGEKVKSKYMRDENDIFLTFQKVTYNQNRTWKAFSFST